MQTESNTTNNGNLINNNNYTEDDVFKVSLREAMNRYA